MYLNNLRTLKYKKFSEFKYKILRNILACGDRISKWNKSVSNECVFCKCKEDISHMLYECTRIKPIWGTISNCLQLNILLKHIILGVPCHNYISENRNICITIVTFSIYSSWYKNSINNGNYATVDLKRNIREKLSFYAEVFGKLLVVKQKSHFRRLIDCLLFHL